MKITRIMMLGLAATLVLAGCSQDENDATLDKWNGEIRLSSGVSVQQTRAAGTVPDTQIANEQEVGVFINHATSSAAISTNLQYTANGSGALTLASGEQPYYPADGADVKIIAYHPYSASGSTPTTAYDFTVATDQSGNSNKDYYASDLLYSEESTHSRSKNALNLTFKHQLSKVVCTLKQGTGAPSLTDATVSIVGAETKVSFKPSDGTVAPPTTGANSAIKMNSSITNGSYIAILPPQTYAKDAKFLEVKLSNGGTYYYKIPNGSSDTALTLAAGAVYKYDITVNQSGLIVTSTIEDWTGVGQPAKEGNAEME